MADNTDKYLVSEQSGTNVSYSGSRIQIKLSENVASSIKKSVSSQKNNPSSADYKKTLVELLSKGLEQAREDRLSKDDPNYIPPGESTPTDPSSASSFSKEIDKQFTSDTLSYEEYKGVKKSYRGSANQKEKYKELADTDSAFRSFIIKTYGSFENYSKQKNIRFEESVYNPLVDYSVSTTIISDDNTIYTTDHISTSELIMEAISGICTFYYIKVDNSSGKTIGTLSRNYVPDEMDDYRRQFFSPLKNDRVIIWDIYKQKWNSFYMSRLWKFVRDETSDLE